MKRKSLILVTIGLTSLLCFGCGNSTSTNESTPEVSEETPEEAQNQEEVEPTEESEEVDTEETVETKEEAKAPVETEIVYLLKDSVSYDPDGNINGEIHNEYNNEGEKIKSNMDGETITYSYEYNNDNVLIKEEALKEDGSIYYTKEFDNDGNEVRRYSCQYLDNYSEYKYVYENGIKTKGSMIIYDENGEISTENNYVYDKFGNETSIEAKTYIEEEILTFIEENTYEYNSDNLPIKKTSASGDTGTVTSIEEFEYDSKGNVLKDKTTVYDLDGNIDYTYSTEYEYDDQNNIIKEAMYDNDELSYYSETEITYDENKNVIGEVYKDQDGNVLSTNEKTYIEMEIPKTK